MPHTNALTNVNSIKCQKQMHFNVSKTSYPAGKCICGQTASFLLHTLKLPGLSKDVVFLVVNFSFFFAYKISLNGC